MEGARQYTINVAFVNAILLMNLAYSFGFMSSQKQTKDDCSPIDFNGKEFLRREEYRTDKTRSFGRPGSKSYPVQKKVCEADVNRSPLGSFTDQPRDCSEILARGENISGIYAISPVGEGNPFNVFCDMDTNGGGWTVFQSRMDGSVDFNRNWSDYKHGFGSVSSEHWLGNDKIHRITNQTIYELRVDLGAFDGRTRYANYRRFSVGDETTNYMLTVDQYSGNAGSSLTYHSGIPFSTWDHDNDWISHYNCASVHLGGWWFRSCFYSHLNGKYFDEAEAYRKDHTSGVTWYGSMGHNHSLKRTEMKMRPVKS